MHCTAQHCMDALHCVRCMHMLRAYTAKASPFACTACTHMWHMHMYMHMHMHMHMCGSLGLAYAKGSPLTTTCSPLWSMYTWLASISSSTSSLRPLDDCEDCGVGRCEDCGGGCCEGCERRWSSCMYLSVKGRHARCVWSCSCKVCVWSCSCTCTCRYLAGALPPPLTD